MAKKDGSGSKEETALATTSSSAMAHAGDSELAAALAGVDIGDGGLGEISNADIKIAVKVFNMKGTDGAGEPIPPNVFFDSVQETTSKTLDLVLLDLHKSNEWREYDEAEGRSKVMCRSNDQVTGVMSTDAGDVDRMCKGCPDAQWGKNEKGKRTRRCGPVYSVIAAELPTGEPCVIRFKKTSLPVIQAHINRHHIGKLAVAPGKRGNVPLFALSVKASLKMSDDKKYAVPVLEKGRVLTNPEVQSFAESKRFYREVVMPIMDKLGDKESDASGGGNVDDTSFDFGGEAPKGKDRYADAGADSQGLR